MAVALVSVAVSAKTLEGAFDEARNSGVLDLSSRKLKEYPKIAAEFDLKDTVDANLSKNRLADLPTEVCMYTSLEVLSCYHNCIRGIPGEISLLHRLTCLDLGRNQLSVLPAQLCQLQSLEILVVANNRLVSLPEELGLMTHLVQLDASWNEISQLPIQICDLGSLRCLNVRKNLLVELPAELCKLSLRSLDLSSNKIQRIPLECRHMKSLEELQLDNNPLICPPAHVCTKGRIHIMKYLHIEAVREDKKRGVMGESSCTFRRDFSRSSLQKDLEIDLSSVSLGSKRGSSASSSAAYSGSASGDVRYNGADGQPAARWPSNVDETLAIEVDAARTALKAAESMREQRQERRLELQRRTSGRDLPAAPTSATATATPGSRSSPTSAMAAAASRLPPRGSAPAHSAVGGRSGATPPTLLYQETNGSVPVPASTGISGGKQAPASPIQQDDMFSKELQRKKAEYEQRKKRAEQIKHEEIDRSRPSPSSAAVGSAGDTEEAAWLRTSSQPPASAASRSGSLQSPGALSSAASGRRAGDSSDRLPRPTAAMLASRGSASSPSAGSPGSSSASSSPQSLSPAPMPVSEGSTRNGSWSLSNQGLQSPPALPPRLQGAPVDVTDGRLAYSFARHDSDQMPSSMTVATPVSPLALSPEDAQLLLSLRKNIESRLKMPLAEDIATALRDGVILCHLANNIKPRSVSQIHVPSPAVPKLTMAKCRKNVDSFIEACRRLGVPPDKICSTADVLEDKRPLPVARTVQALCDLSMARRTSASSAAMAPSPSQSGPGAVGPPASQRRHPLSSAV